MTANEKIVCYTHGACEERARPTTGTTREASGGQEEEEVGGMWARAVTVVSSRKNR